MSTKVIIAVSMSLGAILAAIVTTLVVKPSRVQTLVEAQRDTVWRYDTIKVIEPKLVKTKVKETIYVKADTVIMHDTVYVRLPREEKIYESPDYRAQVSGYKPELDWVEVRTKVPEVHVETQSVMPAKKFGIGLAVGPTLMVTSDGSIKAGLGITGGVTLNF